tara:strand:+ start:1438 stop:2034 length:597 start_codon:yes stop_codon:yes gene_type:complete
MSKIFVDTIDAKTANSNIAFNQTPIFPTGKDPFINVVENWYYHTTDVAHNNGALLNNSWYRLDPAVADTDGVYSATGHAIKNPGMSNSSGIFSFPSTGIWYTNLSFKFYGSGGAAASYGVRLSVTTDGSTLIQCAQAYMGISSTNYHGTIPLVHVFNVTDIANQKFQYTIAGGGNLTVRAGNTVDKTRLQIIKLCPSV